MPARKGSSDAGGSEGVHAKTEELLLAIFALMADERNRTAATDSSLERTELVLANAGLDYRVIASLLGKNPNAVYMLLQRATQAEKAKKTKKATGG
jgi:DNA-directed RNA polymerase specialized sigma24 family protein